MAKYNKHSDSVCFSQTYLTSALVIRDDVVFHKTNEVSISRAKWLLSIVIDFDDFEHFMSLVDEDIKQAEAVISITIPKRVMVEYEAFRNALAGLRQETGFLKELKISIKTEVEQIMRMHDYNPSRTKRSLLPFIGEGLSWLFGVVTDEDLSQIRHQISLLSKKKTSYTRSRTNTLHCECIKGFCKRKSSINHKYHKKYPKKWIQNL